MTPEEYVREELEAGRLTAAHIVELVKWFQSDHTALDRDGLPGPATRAQLEKYMKPTGPAPLVLHCPMPVKGERQAVITSRFKTKNPDRPNHNGVDYFYRWQQGDAPNFVGDKGCAGRTPDGSPKWVVPYGTWALAAADGVVQIAGYTPTGYRTWIDHGNGWRTGYFHLEALFVHVGDKVKAGARLGPVGHNPKDNDARHLHFELSPVDKYAPVDPEPYLK